MRKCVSGALEKSSVITDEGANTSSEPSSAAEKAIKMNKSGVIMNGRDMVLIYDSSKKCAWLFILSTLRGARSFIVM